MGVEERGREEVGGEEVGREKVGMEEGERNEVGKEEVGREEVGRTEVGRTEVGRTEVGEKVEGEWPVDGLKDGEIIEVDPDDSKVEDIVKLSVVRLLLLSLLMSPLPLMNHSSIVLLPFVMLCSFDSSHLLAPTRKRSRIGTTIAISVPILPCMSADHVR